MNTVRKILSILLLLSGVYAAGLYAQAGEAQATVSGTLPVLYVNTEGGVEITSKEDYIQATYYLDGHGEYESIGSAAEPLATEIRGRGNWTWIGFDKKPYRLKLAKKQALLAMPKSKHWALMAGADDEYANIRNTFGYILSRHLGLRWTPGQEPVELVLNGDYRGLYYLTETIRVDEDRVNISEQEDECSHADSITGGWLVEIDNYSGEGNVVLEEGNGQWIMFTMHSPELLSAEQRLYITDQLQGLNDAIYREDSTMAELLDLQEAARFYLVQEVMEDCESYHGSCYLYKDMDRAEGVEKWYFGPVWDFGNAYRRHKERYIYDQPEFEQYWIGRIATHEDFQGCVLREWYRYFHDEKWTAVQELDAYCVRIASAVKSDYQRWQGYQVCTTDNIYETRAEFMRRYSWRMQWLYQQWGEGLSATEQVEAEPETRARLLLRDGQLIIQRGQDQYNIQGQIL